MAAEQALATLLRRRNLETATRLALDDPTWTRAQWQQLVEAIRREYQTVPTCAICPALT
jgi:hypothetical protein